MKKITYLLSFLLIPTLTFAQDTRRPHETNDFSDNTAIEKSQLIGSTLQELANLGVVPPFNSRPQHSLSNRFVVPLSDCNAAYIPVDETTYTPVPRNDDGSLFVPNIGFDFSFCGSSYNSLYINTNGNLSFDAAVEQYVADGFPLSVPMVAPFWADVDTRNPSCGQIWYKLYSNYMIVSWENVGWFDQNCDPLNSFQVIISDGTASIIGEGNNIQFRYADMQWTTGQASGGEIFGGAPATVGFNSGDNENYAQIGRFNKDNAIYDGPEGNSDGVHWLDFSCFTLDGDGGSFELECLDITRELDLDCSIDITLEEIIMLEPDGCSTVELSMDISTFYCDNLGSNIVTVSGSTDTQTETCTATVTITQGTCSAPQIEPIDPLCTTSGSVFLNASPAGGVWSGATTDGIIDPQALGSGTHTVTYTKENSCPSSTSINIEIRDIPTGSINPDPAGICEGSAGTTLSVSADGGNANYNFSWSTPSGILEGESITATSAGFYNVTISDVYNCSNVAYIQVTEWAAPNPEISGDFLICSGGSTTLEANSGYQSYEWSDGSQGQSIEINAPGEYTVSVSDEKGCSAMTTATVIEVTPPYAELTNNAQICNTPAQGSILNLYELINAGDAAGSWTDTDNSGASGPFDQLDFEGVPPGDYAFTYTTNSAVSPCEEVSYTATITTEDCSCPEISLTPAEPICNAGSTINLNALLSTASPGSWSLLTAPPGQQPVMITDSFLDANGADPGIYELQYKLDTPPPPNCPELFHMIVEVFSEAYAGQAKYTGRFCESETQTVSLYDLIEGEDSNGSWKEISDNPSSGGAFDSNAGSFTTGAQQSGLYRFEYRVQGVGVCPDDFEIVDIVINQLPKLSPPELLTLDCGINTLSLNALGSDEGDHFFIEWTGGVLKDGFEKTLTPTVNQPGVYTLTITNLETGCSNYAQHLVEEDYEVPVAEAGSPQTLDCNNTVINLNGAASAAGSNIMYYWNGPGIVGSIDSIITQVNMPGEYTLRVKNLDNECQSQDIVFVNQNFGRPEIEILADGRLGCTSEEITLYNNSLYNHSNYTHTWTDSTGTIISTGTEALIHKEGTYYLEVSNTQNGCSHLESHEVVKVKNTPMLCSFQMQDVQCFGASNGKISINEIGGGYEPYQVSFNGNYFSSVRNFSGLEEGVYPLVIQDANGCEWDTVLTISAPDDLMIDLGENMIIEIGDDATINASLNISLEKVDTLIWAPADLVNCINPACTEIEVTSQNPYRISATVIDENGCTAEDQVLVQVDKKKEVFIPNVFTPNEDGENDRFTIFGNENKIAGIKKFAVLDRWGATVFLRTDFHPNDIFGGWDGKFKGKAMPAGIFTYMAEIKFIDGSVMTYQGYVTLVR